MRKRGGRERESKNFLFANFRILFYRYLIAGDKKKGHMTYIFTYATKPQRVKKKKKIN